MLPAGCLEDGALPHAGPLSRRVSDCRAAGGSQGNRISKSDQKLAEKSVIPSRPLEFSAQGSFGSLLPHDVQRHMAQDREIVWAIVHSVAVLVFVHHDVQTPVEPVFDPPMRTGHRVEALGGHCLAEQVIRCLDLGFSGGLSRTGDLADANQSRPFMRMLEPADLGRDGIVNLTSHGRAWAEGGDAGRHHAAVRAHVSSRQTLNAVAREVR